LEKMGLSLGMEKNAFISKPTRSLFPEQPRPGDAKQLFVLLRKVKAKPTFRRKKTKKKNEKELSTLDEEKRRDEKSTSEVGFDTPVQARKGKNAPQKN